MFSKSTKIQLLKYYYLITSIGVVFHEYAHKTIAESRGVEVKEVTYFNLSGGNLGEVKTGPLRTYGDVLSINVAPFVINTSIAGIILTATYIYLNKISFSGIKIQNAIIILISIWFSISLLLHSYPSSIDLQNIKTAIKYLWNQSKIDILNSVIGSVRNKNIIVRILFIPFEILIYALFSIKFVVTHFILTITTPIVLILYLLHKTKRWGSQQLYPILVSVGCWKLAEHIIQTAIKYDIYHSIPFG